MTDTEHEQIASLKPGLQNLANQAESLGIDREGFAASLIGFGHALIEARDGRLAADSFLLSLAQQAIHGAETGGRAS
ncbi:hypothetical protein GQ651_09305 [Alphaproteobacteria bacterium GH1-50]|uniref:Uncharacterized protein n=1 Tax=Kangsaoukella pontilimi TaxID=2691042 RepID=A0A7C9NEA1_9RHOB|nr:hypothetical protein [Kangsaoukella pontilimi]MXQ08039.1 hypothetical protein [Kangsaoukella pontilimi]